MKKDNPPAAEAGGQPSAAEMRTESTLDMSDEELRRLAVARLAEHLDMGTSLVERCEHLSQIPKGDRLKPLFAAARLLRANALVAQSLALVAQVERRHRTIVEHVQAPVAKTADSNSSLENQLERALRLKMLGYMTVVASEAFDPTLKEAAGDGGAAP